MRILVLNYEYPPLGGGGGVVAAHLAEAFVEKHEISVVTSGDGKLPSLEVRHGVEIHRVKVMGRGDRDAATMLSLLSYPGPAVRKAMDLARHRRFDLVHSHFAVPTGPASLTVARRAGLPHVLSVYGGDLYDPSKKTSPHRIPPLRGVVDWVMRGSDAVVAPSSNIRDIVRRFYSYEDPVHIIPLGIPIPNRNGMEFKSPRPRTEPGARIVTVGRLVRRKAVHVILDVLARPECAAVSLTVVGGGPELGALQSLAQDLGVEDRVTFTGRVNESSKWRILTAADAYVSSAMHEGFGLVFLEAMAAGLPVVCFDRGGQVDFLCDGLTGFIVPAGNTSGLATAIARVGGDPGLAQRIGTENRRRVGAYRIEACASAYAALFRRIIRDRAGEGGFPQDQAR